MNRFFRGLFQLGLLIAAGLGIWMTAPFGPGAGRMEPPALFAFAIWIATFFFAAWSRLSSSTLLAVVALALALPQGGAALSWAVNTQATTPLIRLEGSLFSAGAICIVLMIVVWNLPELRRDRR